jgi:uncharacterized caspase-like protein
MRRALLVGIDDYPKNQLATCVSDATIIRDLLLKNEDGSPNFECMLLTAPPQRLGTSEIRHAIETLFEHEADVALLYFSGHGSVNPKGEGFLISQDAKRPQDGIPMAEVLNLANSSQAKEAVILLDCCYSGDIGKAIGLQEDHALLRNGVSIMTASRGTQTAVEDDNGGVFTRLLRAALEGGASDVIGKVTVASIYAYIDQSLGAWAQRPLFKAHVSKLIPLRHCRPVVELSTLRLLPTYFARGDSEFSLDPSYEPDAEPHDPEHEAIFKNLQKFRDARLVVPVGAEHMYYAAMGNKSCRLTPLGQFYWNLAHAGKL